MLLKPYAYLLLACFILPACSSGDAEPEATPEAAPANEPILTIPRMNDLGSKDPSPYGFRVMPVHRGTFSFDVSLGYFNDAKVPSGLVLGKFMPFGQLLLPLDAKRPELQIVNDPNSAWECQFRFKATEPTLSETSSASIVEVLVTIKRNAATAVCRVQAEIDGQIYTGTLQRG